MSVCHNVIIAPYIKITKFPDTLNKPVKINTCENIQCVLHGTANVTSKFCPECGSRVSMQSVYRRVKIITCPDVTCDKHMVKMDSTFCVECGKRTVTLNTEETIQTEKPDAKSLMYDAEESGNISEDDFYVPGEMDDIIVDNDTRNHIDIPDEGDLDFAEFTIPCRPHVSDKWAGLIKYLVEKGISYEKCFGIITYYY